MNLQTYIPALLGGILIGLASWLLLASLGRVAGVSGIASDALADSLSSAGASSEGAWRWLFLLGLVSGGALFANWLQTPSTPMRPLWLLIVAGLLVGFGTVLGSGCTSGHGVCGLGRRSGRSLVAVCTFMVVGALTVWIAK